MGGSTKLATTVASVPLSSVLLNSANPIATTAEDLRQLAASRHTGAVTTRTTCPNFVHDDAKHQWCTWSTPDGTSRNNTINCLGYSPHDLDYYVQAIKELPDPSKPVFVSVSGYASEVKDMVASISKLVAKGEILSPILVEINLSCPNIPCKAPVAYDFEGMQEYLETVFSQDDPARVKVGVKTAPYFYDTQFQQAAAVLNSFVPKGLNFVTCINTVGCGLVIDTETEAPVLAEAAASFGGLGGPAIHAIALANVRKLRVLLDDAIDVVAVGGVNSGKAAFSHLLCGASAVMVASALLTEGLGVMERIERELLAIMATKGYNSISDFQGKLND